MKIARFAQCLLSPLVVSICAAQTPQIAPSKLVVGQHDLHKLDWIAGRWRSERDGTAPVFEEFSFDNDSTLTVTRFGDGRFAVPTTGMTVALRNHRVNASGGGQWVLNGLDSASASFQPTVATNYSFIWRREKSGQWIEVRSWPPGVDKPGKSETWLMKRVK